jgi:predicted dehydrogenase
MKTESNRLTTRRQFLKTSAFAGGILAAAPAILPGNLFAGENSDTLRVGLIGCGGRGSGAAQQALAADKNVALVAMGDAFEDRLQSSLKNLQGVAPDKVKVTPEKRFVGLDAYQKVIDSGVDVVILATPPGFRPQHLQYAVEKGKHVFCEKPVATDGPGVRSVLASAEAAKKKNLSIVAGFCYRYNEGVKGIMQQVHDGKIGEIRALYTTYNTGFVGTNFPRQDGWSDIQFQTRNWFFYTWASGDHIVEQAVHSIDKMAWAMKDAPPLKCVAHGGRQVRTAPEFGNIFDHFSVVYDYPDGVKGFHSCRQQAGCANDNSDYFMGTDGIANIVRAFTGPYVIKGKNEWRFRNEIPDMYQQEHNELFAGIRNGKPINDGVRMAHSTLVALMGRMAAYTGQEITWDQALNSQESLVPVDFQSWNTPAPVVAVAMPGQTKFV